MFEPLERRELLAVVATLGLGRPAIEGTVAHFDVTLDYAATAGEKLAYFSLDVESSSSSLVRPGPDFSAFSFAKDLPLLNDWTQIGLFNEPGFESTVEFDDSLIASLPSGVYTLGALSVDFGAAGLSLRDSFTVAINGQGTVIGVADPEQGFVFQPVTFNPASQVVAPVSVGGALTVNEGSTYQLTINAPDNLDGNLSIDWGDGQQQMISAADLPTNGTVTHLYSDGPLSPTIVVEVVSEDGPRTAAGSLALTVTNVIPTVSLSGPTSVNEGSPYTLTVGAVSDPGNDTVSQFVIHWGDGQQQTINTADLPTSRAVSHTYLDGPRSPTIVTDVVDEDGTHPAAGSLALTVTNVIPTVSLSGPTSVNEGSPYMLTVGAVSDPGNDTVSRFVIHWGDGQQQTINTADLPTSRAVSHTYLDGPLLPTIVTDVVDEDGTHPAAGSLALTVTNVIPTVSLSGPTTVNEGSPYTLTIGAVNDPGSDTVSHFVIHWGDGQQQTISAVDLPTSGAVTHTYSDGPSSPTIVVDVVDEDGTHQAADTLPLTVMNVAPSVSLSGLATVNNGSPYTLTIGGVNDPSNNTVSQFVIHWGDGQQETFEVDDLPEDGKVTHTYVNGPTNVTILVDLIDGKGMRLARFTRSVEVLGDGTTLDQFDNTASVPGETARNATVFVTAEFTDLGTPETHTAVIDWGDGSEPQQAVVMQTNRLGIATATHDYSTGGVYTITLDLSDPHGTTVTGVTKAYVTGIRLVNGILQIVGSEGNDIVTVTPEGKASLFVSITTPGTGNLRSSFDRAEVQGIDVYVGAGNDRVMVSERLTIATYMDGGPDDDHVQGGDGPNMLLGGPGHDTILGGADRDILVGGERRNRLLGYGDDDILIGGVWQDPDGQRPEAFDTWSSEDPLAVRQTMISELIDITADADPDSLFGGDGHNLYYASESDLVEDGDSHTQYTVGETVALGWAHRHERWAGIFTIAVAAVVHEMAAAPARMADQPDLRWESAESESQAANAADHPNFLSNSRDINRDGFITPQDVVIVINALNSDRAGQVTDRSQYLDSNQDGWITPLDALGTMNYLNELTTMAEGESAADVSPLVVIPEIREPGHYSDVNDERLISRNWPSISGHSLLLPVPNANPDTSSAPDSRDPGRCFELDCDLERVLTEIASDITCAIAVKS